MISMAIKIALKELKKYWGNKKIIFSTLLLPGLVIFMVYSILGIISEKQANNAEFSTVYLVDVPDSFEEKVMQTPISIQKAAREESSDIKQRIIDQDKSILVIFDEMFTEQVLMGDEPNVEVYYNSVVSSSVLSSNQVIQLLSDYKDEYCRSFTINQDSNIHDIVKNEDRMGKNISSMLPMLIVTLVFSACMAVSAESYAGEKERKTLVKLLATPIDRKSIVLGKSLSLGILALVSGLSSFIGAIFSLPKLYAFKGKNILEIYQGGHVALIILDIFSLAILLVTIMSLISARSNTVKEATTTLSPFGGVAMLIGMTSIMQSEPAQSILCYLVPIYNNVQALYGILIFDFSGRDYIVMICINLFYTALFGYILANMLSDEKIMYS